MTVTVKGPWSLHQVETFLGEAVIPMRLAGVRGDGFPQVVSVWFRYRGGRLQCVSHRDSFLVALLQANPKVGFEVAPNDPPYYGVRGRGIAELQALGDSDALEHLIARYLGSGKSRVGNWLLSRREEELLITIEPLRLFSWDYRQRMADVGADQ